MPVLIRSASLDVLCVFDLTGSVIAAADDVLCTPAANAAVYLWKNATYGGKRIRQIDIE
jgi:hypothetical protein